MTELYLHSPLFPQGVLPNQLSPGVTKSIPVTGRGGQLGLCHVEALALLDNRSTDGDEVASHTRQPPFTPLRFPLLNSVRG
jgi:hypothetical protein